MPYPPEGMTEVDNVRVALNEIQAPGVNVEVHILKAVRVGCIGSKLGTVKVEMKDEKSRSSIMKNKRNLSRHPNNTFKSLIIKNLKSSTEILFDNFARDLLKIVPGGSNLFISSNGSIRERYSVSDNPIHTQSLIPISGSYGSASSLQNASPLVTNTQWASIPPVNHMLGAVVQPVSYPVSNLYLHPNINGSHHSQQTLNESVHMLTQ